MIALRSSAMNVMILSENIESLLNPKLPSTFEDSFRRRGDVLRFL